MLVYDVKIQTTHGWVTLASYGEDLLDTAALVADRAVFAHKTHSRVVEREHEEIVHEKFYNRDDDPDENWRDDYDEEDDYGLVWQKTGF